MKSFDIAAELSKLPHLRNVHKAAVTLTLEWVVTPDHVRDTVREVNPNLGRLLDVLQFSLRDPEGVMNR